MGGWVGQSRMREVKKGVDLGIRRWFVILSWDGYVVGYVEGRVG